MTDVLGFDGAGGGLLAGVLAVAVAVLLPFAVAGLFARKTRRQNRHVLDALENMRQGLCMFDAATRIVVCNRRYLELYHLSPEVVKPGCTLRQLLQHRKDTGLLKADPDKYHHDILQSIRDGETSSWLIETNDGRIVHAVNQPMPGGGWVTTHYDVTDRQRLEKERDALAAGEGRRVEVEAAIAGFRSQTERLLQQVGQSAATMKSTATRLSDTSGETSQFADDAVQASSAASSGVKSAAVAAEELAGSIAEIARQLDSTNGVVQTAVSEAEATNGEIAALASAAQRIGDVVDLIRDIAEQTNLLALNATIEAARAGEAGRGFAVVAAEVKSLAVQTARATEDISSQIQAVQSSTTKSVEAIRRIVGRMHEISRYTSSVAVSVEQQNAATGQISHSVIQAADGSNTAMSVFGKVATAVGQSRTSAQTVMEASHDVESALSDLRRAVEAFLAKVAA